MDTSEFTNEGSSAPDAAVEHDQSESNIDPASQPSAAAESDDTAAHPAGKNNDHGSDATDDDRRLGLR